MAAHFFSFQALPLIFPPTASDPSPVAPEQPLESVAATPARPAAAPTPTWTEPPYSARPAQDAEAHWLRPGYSSGATLLTVEAEEVWDYAGSADGGVFAIHRAGDVVGITVTGETAWTLPLRSCVTGSWGGTLLCSFNDGLRTGAEAIDLTTGQPVFEVDLPFNFGSGHYIGADEQGAYFMVDLAWAGETPHPVAFSLDDDGTLRWRTDLHDTGLQAQAALVSGSRLAFLSGEEPTDGSNNRNIVELLDRTSGLSLHVIDEPDLYMDLMYDGYVVGLGSNSTQAFDWTGTPMDLGGVTGSAWPTPYNFWGATPAYRVADVLSDNTRVRAFSPTGDVLAENSSAAYELPGGLLLSQVLSVTPDGGVLADSRREATLHSAAGARLAGSPEVSTVGVVDGFLVGRDGSAEALHIFFPATSAPPRR